MADDRLVEGYHHRTASERSFAHPAGIRVETLRGGERMLKVHFAPEEKLRIAERLMERGAAPSAPPRKERATRKRSASRSRPEPELRRLLGGSRFLFEHRWLSKPELGSIAYRLGTTVGGGGTQVGS